MVGKICMDIIVNLKKWNSDLILFFPIFSNIYKQSYYLCILWCQCNENDEYDEKDFCENLNNKYRKLLLFN